MIIFFIYLSYLYYEINIINIYDKNKGSIVKTVHQYTYDILRKNKITTIFGNPGSNELPFLKNFPDDFRYILALHEAAALSMADGYAQASGQTSFVNLHSAAGTGNAMGALTNACNSHTPIVITAGQQTRQMMGVEALLSNVDAILLPQPLVKWSHEPACAEEVPHALYRAIQIAKAEAAGPVYVSIPYNDWDVEVDDENEHLLHRQVKSAQGLSAADLNNIKAVIEQAHRVVMVVGSDVDRQNAYAEAVSFAEKLNIPVWGAPSPSRFAFPNTHALFQGVLPASIAGIFNLLADYDLILVFGAPVFRYHQYQPGKYMSKDTTLIAFSCDLSEAARAPMGLAYICNLKDCLFSLTQNINKRFDANFARNPVSVAAASTENFIAPERLFDLINQQLPEHSIIVNESTATNSILWERIALSQPSSYFFAAAGGLGFAMPAAVGIQLAQPSRRVVAIIGDGSANYSITALWTAAQYQIPVIFIILKNGVYGALAWFADVLSAENVPGIDIPNIDFTQIAQGYGVEAYRANSDEDFIEIFDSALQSQVPILIEVSTVKLND